MSYSAIKVEQQEISRDRVDRIARFLASQPRWRMLKDDEVGVRTNRYAKRGVENQHWLWMQENQATSWGDFITEWGHSETPVEDRWIQTTRRQLIMPGELFLCDLVGGELWVGRMKMRAGVEKAEKLYQVSSDMNHDYGNCFNGYALLPTDEQIEAWNQVQLQEG